MKSRLWHTKGIHCLSTGKLRSSRMSGLKSSDVCIHPCIDAYKMALQASYEHADTIDE